jgi:hypothetical protein
MAMEFVLVTFPTLRPVRMDGAQQGQTGQIIGVQRGTHIFDLGSPQDYMPPSVQTIVSRTSQMQPLVIPFLPAALPVPVGGPPPGGAAAARSAPSFSAPPPAGRPRKGARKKKSAGRKKKAAPARKKSTTRARKRPSKKRRVKKGR